MPSLGRKKELGDHATAAGDRASLFRQNVAAEFDRLRWARSATKHRISKPRIRHVLEGCLLILKEDPPHGGPARDATRLVFLGEDLDGVSIEVIAVEAEQGHLLVIHAMKLRSRYRDAYEEVRRCNR